ncbi:MAG: acyl-CoA dehydrogenase family protein [Acidimicrobiales bacterium]|nr:acyl-CoA dehydrogenase family protein [Acidimicrobiales bacterium]
MPVDFSLSADQDAVREVFAAFAAKESPAAVVRAAEPLGFSDELWARLRAMDAPGMGAPSSAGGGGAAMAELVVVAECLGGALAPVPFVEHTVATRAHPLAELVSGERLGTVSLRPADAEGRWRLVPAGAVADVVIGIDGTETVAVSSAPPREAPPNHASAPLADRSARHGERIVLGGAELLERALDEWRTLTAAALVGVADAALRIGVDYVLEREQFGRKIGSFQVIQHGLADFPALIDGARFLAHKAAWAADRQASGEPGTIDIDEGRIDAFAPLAAMALLQAGEAAAVCTDRSLHYHGGYGFSLEYDIQLHFRRARGWANVAGDPARERLRLADLLWPTDAN